MNGAPSGPDNSGPAACRAAVRAVSSRKGGHRDTTTPSSPSASHITAGTRTAPVSCTTQAALVSCPTRPTPIKGKDANTVRVVLASGDRWTRNTAADVADVVAQCKRNRLICVLEVHDTTGYGEQSGATTLSRAADYWISVKSALTGQEKYVIVNIGNEPYGNSNYARWTADTKAAVQKLRSAGFHHALMVDAPNWGQDRAFTMRDNGASVFAADPDRNTVFSVHMYGVFDTAAKVNDYLNRFVAAKLPIVVGEFGHNHSDGNPDEDAILAAPQRLRLGYLGWSWSGNSSDVQYLDLVTGFGPDQLTGWGRCLFNGANGIAATAKEAAVFSAGVTHPNPPAAPRLHH